MFYAKTTLSDGAEISVTTHNVYTHCPSCGIELAVNLDNVLRDGIGNLEDTWIFCRNVTCGGKTISVCIPRNGGGL
jgi:hypothetical protein